MHFVEYVQIPNNWKKEFNYIQLHVVQINSKEQYVWNYKCQLILQNGVKSIKTLPFKIPLNKFWNLFYIKNLLKEPFKKIMIFVETNEK